MKKAIPIAVILIATCLYVYLARIRPARLIDPTVRGSGSMEATDVTLAAKIPARIATVAAAEGDSVVKGQVLATLDCAELHVRRAQAEAQRAQALAATRQAEAVQQQARSRVAPLRVRQELADKERQRAAKLFASAGATQRMVDKAEAELRGAEETLRSAELGIEVARGGVGVATAQIQIAEASIALAETQLAECQLEAPMDGTVMSTAREPGELVLPGSTLLKLANLDTLHTWIYVPNKEVGRVRLGQRVRLVADTYPDRSFLGRVTRINEQAEFTPKSIQTKEDRTRLVFGVKVTVDNPKHELMPGMPVQAEVLEQPAAAERPRPH